ncbi:conserved Plasmodium protein, unknown function [Plasmodium relictum]|uniref:Uncharacterized protein n=1 Tax=Plasmodium relictum TaxID=85471 RepID=A0A1J1HCB9_PLARL|nr:conserved Plasmodium protein, unknown function [Plasmodium relictum]CRH03129.1 conserved Plasmodium protein, unknown function [Plasmodium relictum]
MSSRVQLKSTKLQHRKRPRKRKKSEIYRTPVLYHPGQRDYFNLQREYTCLPDEEILNLLSKNKLSLLIKAIKNKDNEEINRILYKDVNNIYLDKNYIYYDESNIKKQDSTYNEDTITKNENKNSYIHNINNNNYKNNNGKNHFLNDNELLNVLEEGGDKENKFIDINNIYFYFKKVNITNINKDNINTDIYKELLQLKKTSLEKEDAIGYNIYKYFLNIITNVDRSKYIDDFFLVNYINNIWITKNVHKYFYFLNSLFDRMKKISYKLFHLNYKIDVIGHEEEKNKMKYFERHELFDKVIKKTKFIPNYIIKHNYIYSNNILNLYEYDINTNSYINKFDETYKEVSLNDFLDINKKKKLNIFYDNKRFEPFYKYAQNYSKDNNLKKIMNITYSKEKYINSVSVLNKNNKEGNDINKNMYNKNDTSDDLKNHFEESLSSENSNQNHSNNYVENEENNKKDNNNSNDLLDKIKNNPELKNEILRKICEKMHSEFCEMKVLDEQGKIDLNKIDDIKNDKDNVLYKKVYAMRDFFYNIYYKKNHA